MLTLHNCSQELYDALQQCKFVLPIRVTLGEEDILPGLISLQATTNHLELRLLCQLPIGRVNCSSTTEAKFTLPISLTSLCSSINLMLKELEISIGNMDFFPYSGKLKCNNQELALSDKESMLLLYLCVFDEVAKSTLMQDIWEYNNAVQSNTLEMHISRLRARLKEIGCSIQIIVNDGSCSLAVS
jgi:hypothetical protein